MIEAALKYLRAGLCVLPAIRTEKRPAVARWKEFQRALPSEEQVAAWCRRADALCLVCGKVSGHLEMLDFDGGGELFESWCKAVREVAPSLLERLVIERSPSGGRHVVYRCQEPVCGNLKLAQRRIETCNGEPVTIGGKKHVPRRDDAGSWHVVLTLIETRGEGGLFLCAPTPGYELVQGDLAELPVLSAEERETLLEVAWSLNEYWPQPARTSTGGSDADGRPGDDFNQRGDVRAILRRHGWTLARSGDNEYWRRPGKATGWSATLKDRVFYVFSSSAAPFEPNKAYSPFAVYALLEHGGDFAAAASALRVAGFGSNGEAKSGQAILPANNGALRRLRLVRADQIEIRPPDWLLRGILERDTLALIFGDPGCGKSFLAIDWAARIATGTPWRGQQVRGGPVVYIAGEGRRSLGRRLRAWSVYTGVDITGVPLFIAPAVALPIDLISLFNAIDEATTSPALIILDTLARCFGGGDENATQDMSNFISACDRLRERYGCTVLIIHHTGHAEKTRARGAMALKAALDAEYRLEKSGYSLTLTATKMKDADIPPPLGLRLVPVELPGVFDEYGDPVTSATIEVTDANIEPLLVAAKAEGSNRGKWLRVGLALLQGLCATSNDGIELKIWREECARVGMNDRTQRRVLQTLLESGRATLNNGILVPNN